METATSQESSTSSGPVHKAADPNPAQPDVFAAGPGVAAPTPFSAMNRRKVILVGGAIVVLGLVILFTMFSS